MALTQIMVLSLKINKFSLLEELDLLLLEPTTNVSFWIIQWMMMEKSDHLNLMNSLRRKKTSQTQVPNNSSMFMVVPAK